jgi:hypothetical protein
LIVAPSSFENRNGIVRREQGARLTGTESFIGRDYQGENKRDAGRTAAVLTPVKSYG